LNNSIKLINTVNSKENNAINYVSVSKKSSFLKNIAKSQERSNLKSHKTLSKYQNKNGDYEKILK